VIGCESRSAGLWLRGTAVLAEAPRLAAPKLCMDLPAYRFAGKVAIVTGAGAGIGAAIASDLLCAGARVAGVGRGDGRFPKPGQQFREASERWHWLCADLRVEGEVRSLVRAVVRRFGRLDILVNNAGIAGPTTPVARLRRESWQQVLEANLTAPFLCARECLKSMVRDRVQGCIINIASVAGRTAYPLRAPYAVSKWGLIGFTMTLAQEAGALNIRVNAVSPGPVAGTPRIENVLARRARALGVSLAEMRKQFERPSAMGRMVTASDVSNAVLFLCSEAARNITGQVIEVSAGFGLCPV
jgi:NAD(P)-dependent dehydrogenase (short-subunit alcohol dehydrogenase family)